MKDIRSPVDLAERLTSLFPSFATEIEEAETESYRQVIQRLTPRITGYLETSPQRTTEEFCRIVNAMAEAGGERENAISTCLLEHASQVKLRKVIRPYLCAAAKRELR